MPTVSDPDDAPGRPTSGGGLSSNIVTTLIGNVFPPLAAFGTAPILAQALGVDGRGELAASTAPFLLITAAATLGMPEAVTYSVARDRRVARAVVRLGMVVLTLSGVVAAGSVALLSGRLAAGNATIESLILLACLASVPALWVGVLRGEAAGADRWRLVATERFVGAAARFGGVAALAASGALTTTSATLVLVTAPVLAGLVYLPVTRGLRRGPAPGTVPARSRLASYGLRVWIGSISGIFLSRIDQMLLNPLAGAYELGLYAVAVNISEVPLIFSAAVRDVTFTADAARRATARLLASARITGAVTLLAAAVIGLSLPLWVPPLFGTAFAAALPTAWLMLVAVAVGTPGSIAGAGLSARGRPGARSLSLTVAAVLNVVALLLLAPRLGAVGAALATLLGNLVSSNLNIVLFSRAFDTRPHEFYGLRRHDVTVVATKVGSAVRSAGPARRRR